MTDMRASILLELRERGFDKAEKAADSLDDLARSADKLGREGRDVQRAGRDVERAADGIARGARKADTSLDGLARAARKVDAETDKIGRGAGFGERIERESREARQAIGRLERDLERLQRRERQTAYGPRPASLVRPPRGAPGSPAGGLGARAGAGLIGLGTGVLGGVAGGVLGGGYLASEAIRGAASDEFSADQLRVLSGQSEAQFAARDATLKASGKQFGIGTQGAYDIYGGLLQGGMDDASAAPMVDPIIMTAKATQASLEDVTASAMAMKNNLKLAPEDMGKAFDAMALGAKEGAFEVRDMAQSFPTLAAQMGLLGYQGMEGVKSITAMAEIVRTVSGTSAEAGNNLENFLAKVTAPDFVKNASDLGVNIQSTMERARTEGVDPLLAVMQKLKTAIGGDTEKLSALVPDRQANIALAGLLKDLDEYQGKMDRMDGASGTVLKDFVTATDNAQSKWDKFTTSIAEDSKKIAGEFLPLITAGFEGVADTISGVTDKVSGFVSGVENVKAIMETLTGGGDKAAVGDFDRPRSASEIAFDPWNLRGTREAERAAAASTASLAAGSPALGAAGARSMDGAAWGGAQAKAQVWRNRQDRDTPGEKAERDFVATRVLGARSAERESMEAMKRQFGSYLAPSGQSFRRGTGGADLSDEVGQEIRIKVEADMSAVDEFVAGIRAKVPEAESAGLAAGTSAGTGVATGFQQSSQGAEAEAQGLFARIRSIFSGGVSVPVHMGPMPAVPSSIGASSATPAPAAASSAPKVTGARATGGPIAAGNVYLAGERGPEVIRFDTPGTVHPAHQTDQLMRRAGSTADARPRRGAATARGGDSATAGSRSATGGGRSVSIAQVGPIVIKDARDPDAVISRIGRDLQTRLAGVLGDIA